VPELMQRFGSSQRQALRVVRMSASVYLYRSVACDAEVLKMRIREITNARVHYGYRRVHVMLRREGSAITSSACIGSTARQGCHCG
jgi:putative transposase